MTTTIVVDSDEKNQSLIRAFEQKVATLPNCTLKRASLKHDSGGDFKVYVDDDKTIALYERKTFKDLVNTISEKRWDMQMNKLVKFREQHPECKHIGVVIEYDVGLYEALAYSGGMKPCRPLEAVEDAKKRYALDVIWTLDVRHTTELMCAFVALVEEDDTAEPTVSTATATQLAMPSRRIHKHAQFQQEATDHWAHMLSSFQGGGITSNLAHSLSRRYACMQTLVQACERDGLKALVGIEYVRGKKTVKLGRDVAARLLKIVLGESADLPVKSRQRKSSGKDEVDNK